MPETYTEFKSRTRQSIQAAVKQREGHIQQIRAAAVKMEHLLNDENWDLFLGRLMPLLDEARREQGEWAVKMVAAMEDKDIRLAQCNYHSWSSRLQTLEQILALPKQIIQDGKHLPPAPAGSEEHTHAASDQ